MQKGAPLLIFTLILIGAVCLILGASLYFLRYIAAGRRLFFARLGVTAFDILGIGSLILFIRNAFMHGWGAAVAFLIILFFTAQCITLAAVVAGVTLRYLRRRLLTAPYDPARRRMLTGAAAYPAVGVLLSGYGAFFERLHTVQNDYTIPIARLPHEAEGMVVAQISDMHLGPYFSVEDFEQLLGEVAARGADLLAVTGDLFDDERQNEAAAETLAAHVRDYSNGIWYCIGNHEYYHDGRRIVDAMARAGRVRVVLNGAAEVPGRGIYIAGVDYPFAHGDGFAAQKAAFFDAAMADVPPDAVTVLLAHHPEFIDDAAARGNVPLTLTGHTHGSQFGFLGLPLFPVFKYTRGMVRIGDNYGYVHVGNGSWFPLRIGCPPEIAFFRLERKKEQ